MFRVCRTARHQVAKKCTASAPPPFTAASPSSYSYSFLGQRRRLLSSSSSSSSSRSSNGKQQFQSEAERTAFLRQANATMEQYHNARQLMKKGKLPRHASHPANQPGYSGAAPAGSGYTSSNSTSSNSAGTIQMAVVGVFLVAFLSTPYIGKRIAQDAEFRQRYIPAWYDYTVQAPDHAWTREELHEQRLQVEQALRRRAAAGDFTPEKLQQLQTAMDGPGGTSSRSSAAGTVVVTEVSPEEHRRLVWDKWHPGLADDEKVNEEE